MEYFHVSTLRIESHRVWPHVGEEDNRPLEGVLVWRVFVDDEQYTDSALPFSANDSILELFSDPSFSVWGDGGGYLSVRRIRNHILWCPLLRADEEYFQLEHFSFPSEQIVVFDPQAYEGTVENTESGAVVRLGRANEPNALPELSLGDLRDLLTFPDPELALYRTPKREYDNLGAMVLRRVIRSVHEELDAVHLSQPPEEYTELRIGLDTREFTESVWHIGKTEQGVAIHFIERPHFPFWLSGAAFDIAIGSEPFLQTGA